MGVGGHPLSPAALSPGKRPVTNFRGGWVDPMDGVRGAENLVPTGIPCADSPARSYWVCDMALVKYYRSFLLVEFLIFELCSLEQRF